MKQLLFTVGLSAAVLLGGCKKACDEDVDACGCGTTHDAAAADVNAEAMPNPVAEAALKNPDGLALQVNEFKMTNKQLADQVDMIVKSLKGNIPEGQEDAARANIARRMTEMLVSKELLLQAATKAGYKVEAADKAAVQTKFEEAAKERGVSVDEFIKQLPQGEAAARKEVEENTLIEKYLKAEVESKIKIDDAEINKQIELVNAERNEKQKLAESLLKKVRDGGDFAKLAEENSDCPSGKQAGGSLGKFPRGQMVKPFDDAVFTLNEGQISETLVETQFGYHIIKTTKKYPAKEATDSEPAEPEMVEASHILISLPRPVSKEEMSEMYKRRAYSQAIGELLQTLRTSSKVVTPYDSEYAEMMQEAKAKMEAVKEGAEAAVEKAEAAVEKTVEAVEGKVNELKK